MLEIHTVFIEARMNMGCNVMTFRLSLLGALAIAAAPAAAQPVQPVIGTEATRQLTLNLTALNTDPRNLRALIGAGEAALALEDANAAIGFFGRADEIDPRSARVKAGLGRALLALEQPREAIQQFDRARALGASEAEIAGDRGLAYDLRGDQRRAQRDYALALNLRRDDEVTRRYALSLAISGDRERALTLLAPLVERQDRAAWRTRAFVLAMSGDIEGASGILRVMTPQLAAPMTPFFARLGGLSAAQKAQAVHFGTMPSDGRSSGVLYAAADIDRPATADSGLIPAGDAFGPRTTDLPRTTAAPVRVTRDPRRRPGSEGRTTVSARFTPGPAPAPTTPRTATAGATKPVAPAAGVSIALADLPAGARAALEKPANPVLDAVIDRTRATAPGFSGVLPPLKPRRDSAFEQSTPATLAQLAPPLDARPAAPPPAVAATTAASTTPALDPGRTPVLVDSAPAALAAVAAVPDAAPARVAPPQTRSLAAIARSLQLEQAETVAPPVPVARKIVAKPAPAATAEKKPVEKKAADKKPAEKKLAEKKPDPAKLHPERVWAQVATGADRKALAADFGKMAKKSPAAFKGEAAWTAPFKATRRLLVGPFSTAKSAQDFIKKAGVTGFAWTSPAGTEIEKLAAR